MIFFLPQTKQLTNPEFVLMLLLLFLMFIYFEGESTRAGGEAEREKKEDPKQAPCPQWRAQRGA